MAGAGGREEVGGVKLKTTSHRGRGLQRFMAAHGAGVTA
jgi:hypothetical protein